MALENAVNAADGLLMTVIAEPQNHECGGAIRGEQQVAPKWAFAEILEDFAGGVLENLLGLLRSMRDRANVGYTIRRADGREEGGLSDARGETHMFGADHHETFKLFVSEVGVGGIPI